MTTTLFPETRAETQARKVTISTIALAASCVVAAGTVIGSATSLYNIGTHVYPAAPWALPLAIDVTAITAGLAVRAQHNNRLARVTLIGLTAFSAALQWHETGSPVAMAVVIGAFLSFELAMSLVPKSMDTPVPEAVKQPTRAQMLRDEAKALGINGRSKMNVGQLEEAIAKAKRKPTKPTTKPTTTVRPKPIRINLTAV